MSVIPLSLGIQVVPVAELVLVASEEVVGVLLLDLRVGHAVADARLDLVQAFPPFLYAVNPCVQEKTSIVTCVLKSG